MSLVKLAKKAKNELLMLKQVDNKKQNMLKTKAEQQLKAKMIRTIIKMSKTAAKMNKTTIFVGV